LIKKEDLLKLIEIYSNEYNFKAIIPVSATKNESVELILNEIEESIPERSGIL